MTSKTNISQDKSDVNNNSMQNGEKILYDINPIKKVGESVKSDSTATNNSISNSNKDVNGNIKNSSRDDEYLELTKEPEKNMGLNQISVDIIFKE